jgi:hypothetical protein
MAVRETVMNPEQKAREQALQYEDESKMAARIAQSLDLPSTLSEEIDAEAKKKPAAEVPSEEPVEEEVEEAEEPETDEAEEEETSLEEEEDLIPKSKVQKRFDEQTAQIKKLERELKAMREEKPATPKDNQQEQLENMSEADLKLLKREVRMKQITAGTDAALVNQYMDLEEKIDQTIRTAPQRFQSAQISKFNQAMQETADTFENFESVKADIFNHAKAIYEQSPELQGSVGGQARAWNFAVSHFTAVQKASEGKSKVEDLTRQVNTMKKKISVDSPSKKSVQAPDSNQRLLKKAVNGTEGDKNAYLRRRLNTDSLVSDAELSQLG